jgi:hypothetical protein
MRSISRIIKFGFAKYPEITPTLGMLGEAPDIRGRDLDNFRRFYTKANLYQASKETDNFKTHSNDL